MNPFHSYNAEQAPTCASDFASQLVSVGGADDARCELGHRANPLGLRESNEPLPPLGRASSTRGKSGGAPCVLQASSGLCRFASKAAGGLSGAVDVFTALRKWKEPVSAKPSGQAPKPCRTLVSDPERKRGSERGNEPPWLHRRVNVSRDTKALLMHLVAI